MNQYDLDRLLGALRRVGVQGALPTSGPQADLVNELTRNLGSLKDAVVAMLTEKRTSPGYEDDDLSFLIDARVGESTYNILTPANANLEGLGVTDGLAVFRHAKGYPLDRFSVTYFACRTRNTGVPANGQSQRSGAVMIYAWDRQRTVFQLDQDAEAQEALIQVRCWSSRPPLSGPLRTPGGTAQTAPADTLVTAGTVPGNQF